MLPATHLSRNCFVGERNARRAGPSRFLLASHAGLRCATAVGTGPKPMPDHDRTLTCKAVSSSSRFERESITMWQNRSWKCRSIETLDDMLERSMPVPHSGCWIWMPALYPKGYGIAYSGNKVWRAHRLAWALANGREPGRKFVCHKCDIPSCVNPDHLFLGTTNENMADMVAKGRSPRGEKHPRAILTDADVYEMRRLYKECSVPVRDLAVKFGVALRTAYDVIRYKKWRHVQ